MGTPGSSGTRTAYRINNRDWLLDFKKLDLISQPDGYSVWRERALGHLCKDRPDVRRWLLWAEQQHEEVDAALEIAGAREVQLDEGPDQASTVSYSIFEAIKINIYDTLLPKAKSCGEGHGLELWRQMRLGWSGTFDQIRGLKSQRYLEPPRCQTITALWQALPAWKSLGAELVLAGLSLPDWIQENALKKLVPLSMVDDLVGRTELSTLKEKLKWVSRQAEHGAGVAQAEAMAKGNKKDGDIVMANVGQSETEAAGSDPVMISLVQECGAAAAAQDWERVAATTMAIQALSKGKGKGKGKYAAGGGGTSLPWNPAGKGGGKGQSNWNAPSGGQGGGAQEGGGKDGGTGGQFPGNCVHCGKYGHKKSECRALDREMQQRRAGGGDRVQNVETPEGEEQLGTAGQDEETAGERWWMGNLLGSMTTNFQHTNIFAALAEELGDMQRLRSWLTRVTAGVRPGVAPGRR